jgi:hypothetical protein
LEAQFPGGKAPAGTTPEGGATPGGTTTTTTTSSTQSNNASQDFSNAISGVIQKVGGQEGLGTSINSVFQQFSQNPETKAIIDKLTSSGVDISKLQPAQIIPTLKQYDTSGILKIDPKLEALTTPQVFGGPLVGPLALNINGDYKWGSTVQYQFKGLRNSGEGPIVIVKFQGGSENMTSDIKLPMTLEPNASTGPFNVNVKLVKGGTTTVPGPDGVVKYDVSGFLLTEKGRKNKYQLYCRGNFKMTD